MVAPLVGTAPALLTGERDIRAQGACHRPPGRRVAGGALSPVLAAHLPDAYPVMWPLEGRTERTGHEIALIRMSALHGATPPAQGGGWDWWPQTPAKWAAMSARVRVARRLLNQLFGREPDEFA